MGQIANQMLFEAIGRLIGKLKNSETDYKKKSESELQAAISKKSFELNYNGGTIWCEHLDGMGTCEKAVINKFLNDKSKLSRPSVSSAMIINLDETNITESIEQSIVNGIIDNKKHFRKIAFVGVEEKHQARFWEIHKRTGTVCSFFDDYEKAKEWVLNERDYIPLPGGYIGN